MCIAVGELRCADLPCSKTHALKDAALIGEEHQATRGIREVFSHCRHDGERSRRRTLCDVAHLLCPEDHTVDFPRYRKDARRVPGAADPVEGHDLFHSRRWTRERKVQPQSLDLHYLIRYYRPQVKMSNFCAGLRSGDINEREPALDGHEVPSGRAEMKIRHCE